VSVKVMARIFEYSRATGIDRLVLLALAFFCNDKRNDNRAWPSLAVLAKRVQLTVPGLCKSLNRLETMGEIRRERSSGGRKKRTRYIICVGNGKPSDTVSDSHNSQPQDSVSEDLNNVSGNSISGNSKQAGSKTVNGGLQAINRNRTRNKRGTESDKPIPDYLSTDVDPKSGVDKQLLLDPTPKKKKRTPPNPATLEAFNRFYQAFPRHVARQDALEAWSKLNPSTELAGTIMAAVERYAADVRDTEPKFILHPATWLNGRRWEDEPAGGNNNGHGPPGNVKDLGDGFIEVDGRQMDRKTYERRYGQNTST